MILSDKLHGLRIFQNNKKKQTSTIRYAIVDESTTKKSTIITSSFDNYIINLKDNVRLIFKSEDQALAVLTIIHDKNFNIDFTKEHGDLFI